MSSASEGILSFNMSSEESARCGSEDELSKDNSFWEFIDEAKYPPKEINSWGDPIVKDMEEVDEGEEEEEEEEEEEQEDEEDKFDYDGDDED